MQGETVKCTAHSLQTHHYVPVWSLLALESNVPCYCVVFRIAIPRIAQWSVYSLFLTSTTPISQAPFEMVCRHYIPHSNHTNSVFPRKDQSNRL